MRRCLIIPFVTLTASIMTLFLLSTVAAARPLDQLSISNVEPDTVSTTTGGTLTIHGSGFTTDTQSRLVNYGLLSTTYVNADLLQAVIPPSSVPAGTYDLELIQQGITSTVLADAVTVVAPTAVPTPKPSPPPGRPILTIRNYSVQPTRPVVGREFTLRLEIYNNGSRGSENTIVAFPGGTFVPVGESGHLLGLLHINHTAVVTQRLRVPSGLSSGTYNVQIDLGANDWEGNHYDYPESVAVEVAGVGHGKPQLVIEEAHTDPELLGPGDAFDLTLTVSNRGSRTATGVVLSGAAPDLALPAEGGSSVALDPIGINRTATVTLPLVLGEVTQAGRRNFDIALTYGDYSGGGYSDQQSVGLEVSTALANRPQLVIDEYEIEPDSLAPGQTFTLTLTIDNVGGGDAQRTTLTLGGAGGEGLGPFAPQRSSNVKYIASVPAGESVAVIQQLLVNGAAEPGAYSLPATLAFDDAQGTRHTEDQIISLLVRRPPHLEIGFYRPVGSAMVGQPIELPIEVNNIGRSMVNVSTLELSSEALEIPDGSFYLGALDGGTAGSWETTATPQEGGTVELQVTINYLDSFEQPQVVTETLTVEVEAPEVEDAEPDAAAPPDEAEETPQGFWNRLGRALRGFFGLG